MFDTTSLFSLWFLGIISPKVELKVPYPSNEEAQEHTSAQDTGKTQSVQSDSIEDANLLAIDSSDIKEFLKIVNVSKSVGENLSFPV